ncbi:MAG TPA: hypothetical protein VG318_10630 [Actinomycetota bacterium]|nr:hypothetical protein [Actinomycetota bacterium]
MRGIGVGTKLVLVATVTAALPAAPGVASPVVRTIDEDTTWTKEQSPVYLDTHVQVNEGVTLTIEPGVRVEAWDFAGLIVLGGLRAEGTEAEPIVFTGVDGAYWQGIRIVDTASVRPPSALAHARVENAMLGISMRSDAFPIHDTVFTGNIRALEVVDPATNLSFTRNRFYSNGLAFLGQTQGVIGIYESDFWDNGISMLFSAPDPYACVGEHGIFDVHYNDILRGPDRPWWAFDVRSTRDSGSSNMVVNASGNWWGTTNEADISARVYAPHACCPPNGYTAVQWKDPAATPQTASEPPGPQGTPAQQPDYHGDPAWTAVIREPDDRDCHPAGTLRRIHGTVHPALGDIPKRMEVWLVRVTPGGCRSWSPSERRFGDVHPCGERSGFRVKVHEVQSHRGRWEVELPRPLSPGKYEFLAGQDAARFRVVRG